MVSLQNESNCWVYSEMLLVSSPGLSWKIDLANATMWGQLAMWGKDSHHLPVLHANRSEGLSSVNVTVKHILHFARITAYECPLGYVAWSIIGWLLATQVQLVGLTAFCLERPNGSTPNGTQHSMGWQTCTVTADTWLGHQNVFFKAGAFPPTPWG